MGFPERAINQNISLYKEGITVYFTTSSEHNVARKCMVVKSLLKQQYHECQVTYYNRITHFVINHNYTVYGKLILSNYVHVHVTHRVS